MTRKRPLVHLSLSPDAITRLAEIATRCGETRSGVVEKLIREAEMPRPARTSQARTSQTREASIPKGTPARFGDAPLRRRRLAKLLVRREWAGGP